MSNYIENEKGINAMERENGKQETGGSRGAVDIICTLALIKMLNITRVANTSVALSMGQVLF